MKEFKYIVLGLLLGVAGGLVAQTPTIFSSIRVNGQSDLRGNIVNTTGNVTVNDNLVVTGTCTGCGGVTFPILAPDGSDLAPSYSFSNQPESGIWSDGDDIFFQSEQSMQFISDIAGGGGSIAFGNSGISVIGQSGILVNDDSNAFSAAATSGSVQIWPNDAFHSASVIRFLDGVGADGVGAIMAKQPNSPGASILFEPTLITVDGDLTCTGVVTGCGSASFPLLAPDGTLTDPSYSFSGHTLAGMTWNAGTSTLAVSNFDGANDIGLISLDDDEVSITVQNTGPIQGIVTVRPAEIDFTVGGFTVLQLLGTGIDTPDISAAEVGYKGVPQNIQALNYTLDLDDPGKHIYHANGAGAGDQYTIPQDSVVSLPVSSVVMFVNSDPNDLTIDSAGDTVVMAGSTSVTPCTLSQNGVATALKVGTTEWILDGTGLTCTP